MPGADDPAHDDHGRVEQAEPPRQPRERPAPEPPAALIQTQHVGHVVAAGGLVRQPERRLDRAAGEDLAALGAVAELDPLALGGEDRLMVAGDRAAAQRGEADMAGRARRRSCRRGRGRWPGSRSTPRPSAAAAPSSRAVPEGASTLWRWCISTISTSQSLPSRAAASRTRWASRLTPSDMFADCSTAILARRLVDRGMMAVAEAGRADHDRRTRRRRRRRDGRRARPAR